MNILVAGGAGYIGSHVAKELVSRGHRVVVLDDLSRGHRDAVGDLPLVVGSTGDRQLVTEVLRENRIEAVMHFAAHSLVGESMVNPGVYFTNNVAHSLVLLEAMAALKVKYLVFSSTAAVYGEPQRIPILEEHPAEPASVYGASKLMFEQALHWYGQIHGIRHSSLRYFNAAGADESGQLGEDHRPETHLVPILLQAALGQREKVEVFGDDYPTPDGTCIRDYIHVSDLSRAHLLALEALRDTGRSSVYNLGNGTGYSVLEVIQAARKVTGRVIPLEIAPRRKGDPAVLVASSEKIKRELGWEPRYDLEGIIASAWEWHRRHPQGYRR